jgi:hypothetical protein
MRHAGPPRKTATAEPDILSAALDAFTQRIMAMAERVSA